MRSALGCIALGFLLLLVAGTFDAEPLYVTGAALALLGLAAIAWIGIGGRGATITRTLSKRSVVEEEPLQIVIEARAGKTPLPPGWIEEPLVAEPVRIKGGRRATRFRIEATFARRGRRRLAPPSLVLRDPLGLVQRAIPAAHEDELLVLPRTYPVVAARGEGTGSSAGLRALLTATAEVEIDGLRPYREGAPASRIHWQSVARGRGLMERRMISEADSRPLIVLDPRGAGDAAAAEQLDRAARAAGSLVLHFAREAGVALLLPGDRRAVVCETDLAGWPQMHVRLALVDDRVGPSYPAAANRRGVVVVVSARVVDRPPRGLPRTPGGCILVVPGELPNRRPLFEVAGCFGYATGRPGGGAAARAAAAIGGGAP